MSVCVRVRVRVCVCVRVRVRVCVRILRFFYSTQVTCVRAQLCSAGMRVVHVLLCVRVLICVCMCVFVI